MATTEVLAATKKSGGTYKVIAKLRWPAVLLFAALLAQSPHAGLVFMRNAPHGGGLEYWLACVGAIVYALALEGATAWFVWQHKTRLAALFAIFSVAHNVAYYMPAAWAINAWGAELAVRNVMGAVLISLSLPIAIAAFSHTIHGEKLAGGAEEQLADANQELAEQDHQELADKLAQPTGDIANPPTDTLANANTTANSPTGAANVTASTPTPTAKVPPPTAKPVAQPTGAGAGDLTPKQLANVTIIANAVRQNRITGAADLAAVTGVSERTIQRYLPVAVEAGYIYKNGDGAYHAQEGGNA